MGYLEGQDTTLGLSLITDVGVLLTHTNHDTAEMSVSSFFAWTLSTQCPKVRVSEKGG